MPWISFEETICDCFEYSCQVCMSVTKNNSEGPTTFDYHLLLFFCKMLKRWSGFIDVQLQSRWILFYFSVCFLNNTGVFNLRFCLDLLSLFLFVLVKSSFLVLINTMFITSSGLLLLQKSFYTWYRNISSSISGLLMQYRIFLNVHT